MSLSSTLISTMFCLLATSLLMVAAAESEEKGEQSCNPLHAAFFFRGTYFFIYGDNAMKGFNRNGDVVYNGHASAIFFDKQVTAAVGFPHQDMFFLVSGKHEQAFNDFSHLSQTMAKEWTGAEDQLARHPDYQGVDAATMTGAWNIIYFAGCQYVEIDPYTFRLVGSGLMKHIGLPCHVDAAFHAPTQDIVMVIKGQEVFVWSTHERNTIRIHPISEELAFLIPLNLCNE